jgi:Glycosyl transferase family 2
MSGLSRALRKLRVDGPGPFIHRVWETINKTELVEFGVQGYILPWKISHIHGLHRINYAADELLVVCVVRNGESYVRAFMEHYRKLGVKHFVFLDNGSTDATVQRLCVYPNVTVLQTYAKYQYYENTMKRYLLRQFGRGRWILCADIDELFDYPSSKTVDLASFLRYLSVNGFNAVVTQMLDMISDMPLQKGESAGDIDLKQECRYYDISSISNFPYTYTLTPNPKITMRFGGIRKRIFGTNNGLTKASLLLMDGKIKPFIHWHHARNARIADVSCVLLHYPFVHNFYEKVQDAIKTRRYGFLTTDEYQLYWQGLQNNRVLEMLTGTCHQLTDIDDLVRNGFLIISERYTDWVRSLSLSDCRAAATADRM